MHHSGTLPDNVMYVVGRSADLSVVVSFSPVNRCWLSSIMYVSYVHNSTKDDMLV